MTEKQEEVLEASNEVKPEKTSKSRKKNPKTISEEQAGKFHELLSKLDPETAKVGLFSHRYPDPDAIGSMMGLSWFLKRVYGLSADIIYEGEVAHPQNKIMVGLLQPIMIKASDLETIDSYDFKILVDTIPSNAGTGDNLVDFDVVIDHHKELPPADFEGEVFHRKAGSCCGIIFDLIKQLLNPEVHEWFDHDVDADCKVATALITGIVTDTGYMLADDSTELEFNAYTELFQYRHSDYLKQIVFFKRPQFWILRKATACSEADVDDEGCAIVGLGMIPDSQRDIIADMAEEMVSWASVETAIAFGIVGGDKLEGSVRSLNPSISVSDLCKSLGGAHGSGGGKHGKGAYRRSLGAVSIDQDEDESDVEEAWESLKKRETKRVRRIFKK